AAAASGPQAGQPTAPALTGPELTGPELGRPVLGRLVRGGLVLGRLVPLVPAGPVPGGPAGTVSSARTTSWPSPWRWRSSSATTSAPPRWRSACGCWPSPASGGRSPSSRAGSGGSARCPPGPWSSRRNGPCGCSISRRGGRLPLATEDRVDQLIRPLALDELVLDQVRL